MTRQLSESTNLLAISRHSKREHAPTCIGPSLMAYRPTHIDTILSPAIAIMARTQQPSYSRSPSFYTGNRNWLIIEDHFSRPRETRQPPKVCRSQWGCTLLGQASPWRSIRSISTRFSALLGESFAKILHPIITVWHSVTHGQSLLVGSFICYIQKLFCQFDHQGKLRTRRIAARD